MMAVAASLRWAGLTGLYLALVGQGSTAEITAGLLAALAAAALSLALRQATGRPLRLRAPWLRLGGRLCWSILRDTERVAVALAAAVLAGRSGSRVTQPLTAVESGSEEEAGHRALVILLSSVAPNGYVLGSRRTSLTLHRLAEAAPSADPRWPI